MKKLKKQIITKTGRKKNHMNVNIVTILRVIKQITLGI